MRFALPLIVLSTLAPAFGIGWQHGKFRSQATQGPAWIGTAFITKERLVITVYPDYLDVEHDWEFGIGGTQPAQHEKALEIVGNINFERGASIIGMLVWYKDLVLKAKLKTTAHARKEYEEVVDRNTPVPPKPRDPVLLERIDEDNYDISIFPVEWGGTRKVRLRYLVPSRGAHTGFPHAYTFNAEIFLKFGSGVKAATLVTERQQFRYDMPGSVVNPSAFRLTPWDNTSSKPIPYFIKSELSDSVAGSRMYIAPMAGTMAGTAAHLYFRIPEALQDTSLWNTGNPSLSALIRSESDSCRKLLTYSAWTTEASDELRIYSKDPLLERIAWRLRINGDSVREVEEIPKVIRLEDGAHYARTFGTVDFYPMSPTMPRSLGVSLGLIDRWYSLVALEKDALPENLARLYADHGVPGLEPSEIFPEAGENFAMPTNDWLSQRGRSRGSLLAATRNFPVTGLVVRGMPQGLSYVLRNGRILIEIGPELLPDLKGLQVSIHAVDGRLIKSWSGDALRPGRLSWSPSEASLASGTFLLKVRLGSRTYSQAFRIHR